VSPVKYELGFYIPEDGLHNSHRRENLKSYGINLFQCVCSLSARTRSCVCLCVCVCVCVVFVNYPTETVECPDMETVAAGVSVVFLPQISAH
jgi:hypothetical protein